MSIFQRLVEHVSPMPLRGDNTWDKITDLAESRHLVCRGGHVLCVLVDTFMVNPEFCVRQEQLLVRNAAFTQVRCGILCRTS